MKTTTMLFLKLFLIIVNSKQCARGVRVEMFSRVAKAGLPNPGDIADLWAIFTLGGGAMSK